MSFSIKKSIVNKLRKIPVIGKQAAQIIEQSTKMDFSVQGFFSGSGYYTKKGILNTNSDCPGFCELAFTLAYSVGNGAHGGGNDRGYFAFGVWGDGSGVLDFCTGTITVSGGINMSVSLNLGWLAYNREFNSTRAYLIGPDGWLMDGGPYNFLQWK